MIIEKGKFYKTRDGRKAEVLTTDLVCGNPAITLVDGELYRTTLSGCYGSSHGEHPADLVSEWREPFVMDGYALLVDNFDMVVVAPTNEITHSHNSRVIKVRITEIPE